MKSSLCIGLFGSCGTSKWRDKFIKKFTANNIKFFNPLKEDWKPEDAKIEAEHLASDEIILIAITGETFSSASLAETGYAILNTINSQERRSVVIFIDQKLNPLLEIENPTAAKESKNARKIILSHLEHVQNKVPNVKVVNSLDEMLTFSVNLYKLHEQSHKVFD